MLTVFYSLVTLKLLRTDLGAPRLLVAPWRLYCTYSATWSLLPSLAHCPSSNIPILIRSVPGLDRNNVHIFLYLCLGFYRMILSCSNADVLTSSTGQTQ